MPLPAGVTYPGIRVPLAISTELWLEAVDIGRQVIWLHTYGERYCDESAGRPRARPRAPEDRRPRLARAISASPDGMPDHVAYAPASLTMTIGRQSIPGDEGIIEQVSPAVWAYTAGGGVPVVRRWLNYRLRDSPHKRQTSPLDGINPNRWTAQFDDELLDLLNMLDRCVALEPRQAELLERVCAGPLLTVADLEQHGVLPVADAARRPRPLPTAEATLGLDTYG